jgi:putative transposase
MALAFNRIRCGPLSYKMKAHPGRAPRQPYLTARSDHEWDVINHLGPAAKPGGRPEKSPERAILEALSSSLRGGWAARLLPHDFPPWPMVYKDGWRWQNAGPWPRR